MTDYDGLTPGQVLEDASVAEFISQLGLGIAAAQRALDENSVDQIAEFITPRDGLGGRTLLDLGLSPAFYHFQHADISCSLQLTLRVQKDLSLGLNLSGSFSDTTTSSSEEQQSASSTESGSETRTETRSAQVNIEASSTGALSVGGQTFQLSGPDALTRIRDLQRRLNSTEGTGVGRALVALEPQPLDITTDANDPPPAPPKVAIGTNTVAFVGGGFSRGIIQITQDTATDYTLDTSPAVTVSTTAQGSVPAYAEHVATQIRAEGYDATAYGPDVPLDTVYFDTGMHHIATNPPDLDSRNATTDTKLLEIAHMIRDRNMQVTIEGFADAQPFRGATQQQSAQSNRDLGDRRARAVRDRLVANGAPAGNITITPSRGSADAIAAGGPADNIDFRKAEVRTPGTEWWVHVKQRSGGNDLESVSPDLRSGPVTGQPGNGFIYLYRGTPLSLGGKKVTVEGDDYPLRGSAGGGNASGSGEAYAFNLAADVNGNAAATYTASAEANVVTLLRKTQPIRIDIVTAESRSIQLSGTSGVTVTREFTRTESRSATRQNTGNRAVAFGASLDVRYSRQFEMNVTGNSAISARLVSIPAPPQFLETIRAYLSEGGA
ncbi:MAG: OmpA family protein [Pseudomonadales bacterium]|jgi:outer membrane protein OmpA-like peptidoglycan-associated protein|nr:OmpA family protein [Pseudomonadales bacterium]